MSEDLDRYFAALRHDAGDPVLADVTAIRRTGDRRTRNNRLVGGGVACLAAVAAVFGVTSLTGHDNAGRVPVGPGPSRTVSVPPSPGTEPSGPPSGSGSQPPSGPASTPASPATHACGPADFGNASAYSDGAAGTQHWVVTFYDIAQGACTLSPRTATVRLTDPDTGKDVKLKGDDTPPAKITVRPGQQVGFTLTMATVALESANDPSCRHAATYHTVKVQLDGGVFTVSNLAMNFSCKGHNDAGPTVGGWGAG